MSIVIRSALYEDSESIAALGLCVWIDTYATKGVSAALSNYVFSCFTPDYISGLIASKKVLVAEVFDHLVGYAVLNDVEQSIEIDNLYVLPRFQGRGVGRKLIEHISTDHPRLWLACWEENKNAIGFYKSIGFTEEGESIFNLDGQLYRNVLLTKRSC